MSVGDAVLGDSAGGASEGAPPMVSSMDVTAPDAAGNATLRFSVDDPARRRPDIARARRLLGWAPTVSVEEGLRATIDYFRRLA